MPSYPDNIELNKILAGDFAALEILLQGSFGDGGSLADSTRGSQSLTKEALNSYLSKLQTKKNKPIEATVMQLLKAVLPQDQYLEQKHALLLRFVDAIFKQLVKQADIDDSIIECLQGLHLPLAILALEDKTFLTSKNHPAHQLIDDVCEYSIGWYPDLGKAGERFFNEISTAINTIENIDGINAELIKEQQLKLRKFFEDDALRTKKLGERQCDTEAGKLKARQSEELAINYLNRCMKDTRLPEAVINFLHHHWLESLKLCHLNHGDESEEWASKKELTKNLIWSFKANKTDAEEQQKFDIIPLLNEQLRQALISVALHDEVDNVLSDIEQLHIAVLKGVMPERVDTPCLESVEAVDGAESDFTISLIDQILCYTEGQWMLYRDDSGQWTRCQLARKIEGINQLLFLNRQGVKIMAKGLGEVAFCLSQEIAKPIEACRAFTKAYHTILKQLKRKYQQNREAAA